MEQKLILFRGIRVTRDWPHQIRAAQRLPTCTLNGVEVARVRYGRERRPWIGVRGPCGDCAVIAGEYHVPGCDLEQCPSCAGQLLSCRCTRG
jgi:hypothetical protein